ncbi:hypothetical protein CYMTET_13429 [Cymbomonas tetramitiformis]|uniref:Cytochrome b5 heme-binding domain-containing protein n=1 Tax=Cymbomonas tetramitiformis TaxID=36881 RepID=A0AAE0GJN3_9CHLO|nr:hypothetical protein CYMTET_13429 [Cymbomonas tetramitiformis]|eukprot:gene8104-9630_t
MSLDAAADRVISLDELAKHNKDGDLWIAVDGHVLDCTKFAKLHPGGKQALLDVAGKDATMEFYALHRSEVIEKYLPRLKIGVLSEARKPPPSKVDASGLPLAPPYCSIPAFQPGWKSPYYNETHHELRRGVRDFIDKELRPIAIQMDTDGIEPKSDLVKKCGDAGILAARLGPGPHLKGRKIPGDVAWDKFDYFHELVLSEEFCRLGCPGFGDGLAGGLTIGLPPVAMFASEAVKRAIIPPVLNGDKRICLAISDAYAGSDAAGITAVATRTPCGGFFEVTGTKKWITGGCGADYFCTAVRTGPKPGAGGVSLLLIERTEGVTTKAMSTRYGKAAGTAFVTFDKARVPVGNLLGEENKGFKCIMFNFNHERWVMCCTMVGYCRVLLEESMRWSTLRKAFGKPLLAQPVIRERLAAMTAETEACHAWVETLTYQMCNMDPRKQHQLLGGPIALCKARCSRAMASVANNAAQVFGGRAITKTGMGSVVERVSNYVKFGAILGGSEEILDDLAMRQAAKEMAIHARL